MTHTSTNPRLVWSSCVLSILLALPAVACLDEREGASATDTDTSRQEEWSPGVQAAEAPPAAREGDSCLIDEDCGGALLCAVDCDDSCDQSQWPNPCCTATCRSPAGPYTCPEEVGLEVREGEACPAHTVAPSVPGDWVLRGVGCCFYDRCDWQSRFMCEASSACQWRLTAAPQRPNEGNCESVTPSAP